MQARDDLVKWTFNEKFESECVREKNVWWGRRNKCTQLFQYVYWKGVRKGSQGREFSKMEDPLIYLCADENDPTENEIDTDVWVVSKIKSLSWFRAQVERLSSDRSRDISLIIARGKAETVGSAEYVWVDLSGERWELNLTVSSSQWPMRQDLQLRRVIGEYWSFEMRRCEIDQNKNVNLVGEFRRELLNYFE